MRHVGHRSWSLRGSAWALGALILAPAVAGAQGAGPAVPPIRVVVSVGYAMSEQGSIHSEFRGFHSQTPRRFGSIQMHEQRVYDLKFGEEGRLSLPTGTEIRMRPIEIHGRKLHLQFEMPGVVNTRMQLPNGRPVILGGVPFKHGQLIIQVRPDFTAFLPRPSGPSGPEVRSINSPSGR